MTTTHDLMDGALHVYKRPGSNVWQCSTFLNGRNLRISTKQIGLKEAKDIAEDWYLGLRGKIIRGENLASGKRFEFVAKKFIDEFEVLTLGERNPIYVQNHRRRIDNHLLPYFKGKYVREITSGMVQEYRAHRVKTNKNRWTGEPHKLARSTLHQEIVCLRQILTVAESHGWIDAVPTVTPRYKTSGKISHRAWFSPEEYKRLYEATRARAKAPARSHHKRTWETLHDYVLFIVNTGLRPDEARRLEFRDVTVVTDEGTGERILEIEVRGKRGVGFCKSMPGAVMPLYRLKERRERELGAKGERLTTLLSTEKLFPKPLHEVLNIILDNLGLKHNRDAQARTAYSLRHTYICLRLMEGADIYQIAKNCRTSVEMIEKYYASHIKDRLDASAINRMKPRQISVKPTAETFRADLMGAAE